MELPPGQGRVEVAAGGKFLWASAEQVVIFGVRSDPEPDAVIVAPDAKRAMVEADARRPQAADALEAKRRMQRIGFQQREILVGQTPGFGFQPVVMRPEGGVGLMVQRGRVRPASKSARA